MNTKQTKIFIIKE